MMQRGFRCLVFAIVFAIAAHAGAPKKQVGAYLLLREGSGLGELDELAKSAATLPLTRVTLSFFGM